MEVTINDGEAEVRARRADLMIMIGELFMSREIVTHALSDARKKLEENHAKWVESDETCNGRRDRLQAVHIALNGLAESIGRRRGDETTVNDADLGDWLRRLQYAADKSGPDGK